MKIDIGCGSKKLGPDWIGVDQYPMNGVDFVVNFAKDPLPFENESVDEVYCSHVLEHLTNLNDKWERIHLFNEVYRVLKEGGRAKFIFPHWCSQRYYGDPTHKEPFSEMGFLYLAREWRQVHAPHADISWNKCGYDCDFTTSLAVTLRADVAAMAGPDQQLSMMNYKDACEDIIADMVKIGI
ncbi:MAG: class I SAM-dependent methyltransferase [Betaproteobacteria bacterium]